MKILLVDDDPKILKMLSDALRQEQCLVDESMDGDDAFARAKSGGYDVIVLDIGLPGRSGFGIISALRALGNATPILVISSHGTEDDRVNGLNLGADDYLVKNFSLREFVARVKALLRRPQVERRNVLSCADLVMNLSTMQVSRGKEKITLSRKEFNLLHRLLQDKGQVVSRDELLRTAWKSGQIERGSNSLDVHLSTLRKKIDHGSLPKIFHTIRGSGYFLGLADKKNKAKK